MRIALITPGFSAGEDDWCIPVLLDHVRALAREHDVRVFALRYPHRRGSYRVGGATVHALGGALAGGAARLPLLARAMAAIAAEARRRPFDAYHGCWADEPGLLAALAGRLARRPALVSVMGGELVGFPELGYGGLLSRANRLLARVALRAAGRVTVGSAYLGRLAADFAPAARLAAHPWGVDTRLFRPEPGAADPDLGRGRINLLQAGSLIGIKDHRTSLLALKLMRQKRPAIHLHLLGAGPLEDALRRTAGELGVAEHITFHGAQPHEALPGFYRAADLCLLSSRHEAQALVILEAAACGRATVGTAVGMLPDLPPAPCVPVGDAAGLAAAALGLLGDPPALRALGGALADHAATHSLDASVARLLALYRAGGR